ncbi:MAG: SDR family NAD(P)-dependent oxidoreductase [Lachnospiraceae bacterium]
MKTILITGSTDGIGLETAKLLAKEGHNLLIHGRNAKKLDNVKKELLKSNSNIKTYLADLSILKNTENLAEEILATNEKIDVIINNAGVFVLDETTTKDRLDTRFAVNTISPYLLTKMLLPILSDKGRIVNLSSAAQTDIDFEAMRSGKKMSHDNAYAQSKLAIAMWGIELAEELGDKAVVISVNPKSFLGSKMVKKAYGRQGYDLSIGANILYRASLSEEFAEKTGSYYDNDYKMFSNLHPFALNKQNRIQLITTMDEIIKNIS